MDITQRFLRRIFLMENIDYLLRESKYHRDNDEEEDLAGLPVWNWDDEEGELPLGEKDDNPQ